ncbi:MAG: ABC transporter permease [Microthrixaceae bacterium]|nr:ABC transporter permease [Microthrixaceae bacterium]
MTSAWSGLVLWMFFATSVTAGTASIVSSASLVTKVYFPREALPLAATGSAMLDLGIGLLTVVALIAIGGAEVTRYSLLVLLPVAMLVCWTAAVSVFLGAVAVFARDTLHLVQLVVRVGIFATPVFYGAEVLPSSLAWLEVINPVAVAIEAFRSLALCGVAPDWRLLLAHGVAASCALVGSVLYVRSVESRISDLV